MRLSPVILASLTLAACAATPKARIADTLIQYGLDRPRANCVGGYLQSNLTPAQLLELARAAEAYRQTGGNPQTLTMSDLLRVSSQIQDPHIPVTLAKAAGQCGLVPAAFSALL